ncbi:MAG: hypothetical protein WBB19_17060 [Desulforhopalus sp.]
MKPTEGSIHTPADGTKSHITDIVLFFAEITSAYAQFEQNILCLCRNIPELAPKNILDESKKLRDQKAHLEILDQQMFDIINLAGEKIAQEPMIQDYRVALARANTASNELYQKISAIKEILQEQHGEAVD